MGMTYKLAAIAATGRGHAVADPARTPLKVKPTMISKVNTCMQFGTIGMALSLGVLGEPNFSFEFNDTSIGLINGLSYLTGATTIFSGLSYIDGKSMVQSNNSLSKKR